MSASIHRSAMDALWEARRAWARQDQQTSLDLWGDSPDHVEGHSRTRGLAPPVRGTGSLPRRPSTLLSVLNAAPDPPVTLAGRCVEGGRTERQGRDGRGSESARAWLTAAAASHAHGGCAPPPSTETKQGEA